jgi:membrane protein
MVTRVISTPHVGAHRAFAGLLRRIPRRIRWGLLVARRTVIGFVRHEGLSWAASMAFWLVLSLPPLLIAISSFVGAALGHETAQSILAQQVAAQLPAQGEVIRGLVDQEIQLLSVAGLGSVLFLLFSGSRVFAALVMAVNVMWSAVPTEGLLRRLVLRVVLALTIGGMLVASVLLQLGILGAQDRIGPLADVAARYVLPFGLVVGGLFLTYRLVPWRLASTRTAFVAAVLTAVLLRGFQALFSFLLAEGVDFSTAYGSLAGIAILMTWAMVTSSIVLLGAEFVSIVDRRRP